LLGPAPILFELFAMKHRPLAEELEGSARANLTGDQVSLEIERAPLTRVLGMKVRRRVVVVKHSNQDAEEGGNCGHAMSLPHGSAWSNE
jgi:hypothetical protein